MVVAMAGFAIEDVLLKQMTVGVPVGQVLAMVGFGSGLIFAVMGWLRGKPLWSSRLLAGPVMLRNLSEAGSSAAFVTALALTTLSSASAILQATPLAVTLGAALFLDEKVGWRRWTAVAVGFAGVLLVLRPGLSGFTPASLLAVIAVFLLAARDLSSRVVPLDIASVQLAAWGLLSLVPAGLLLMLSGATAPVVPSSPDLLRLAAVFVVGGIGYYAIIAATRGGDLSTVMPFRYTRLVFTMALGVVVFGERPDALTLAGAALIVGTGMYTIWRTARRRAEAMQAA